MVDIPIMDAQSVNPDNDPVIAGLSRRRAEIAGHINHLVSCCDKAKRELEHVDAVLGMYGVDVPAKQIRSFRSGAAGLFHPKELPRRIMEHLKASPDGYTCRQITELVCRDKGWSEKDNRFVCALSERVGKVLARLRNQGRVQNDAAKNGRGNVVWSRAT